LKIRSTRLSLKFFITMLLFKMWPGIASIKTSLPVVQTIGSWWSGIIEKSQMVQRDKRSQFLKLWPIQMKSILWIFLLSTNFYYWADQQMRQPQSGTCETWPDLFQQFKARL
jgi:hypothetical protein